MLFRSAEALRQEITSGGRQSAQDRFIALTALIAQAGAQSKLVSKEKRKELIDSFFEEYYAIVDGLEANQENFIVRFKSGNTMLQALFVLYNEGRHDKLIAEIVRFLPSMRLFYKASNFTSWPEALNLFLYVHMLLAMSTGEWLTQHGYATKPGHPLQEIKTLALVMMAQGAELLKDADPDNQLIGMVRANLGNMLEKTNEAREDLFSDGAELADVDELIEKKYNEYASQKN